MIDNEVFAEKTVLRLLDDKKYQSLRDVLSTMNAVDVGACLEGLQERKMPLVFRLLPKELAADAFVEMTPERQELLIRGFSDTELKEILDELFVDDAVDVVEEMPANVVQRILRQAEPELRNQINEILRYPEDSAGSLMTTEYVTLRPEMTVEEALLRIRRTGVDKETIYTCYVMENRRLLGLVSVKDLLLCDHDGTKIRELMRENAITVSTMEDQEEVIQIIQKYDLLAVPVLDTEDRMVGIITFDDVMDIMEDETTEDMEVMAAMLPSDKPYARESVSELVKRRIPWLLFLMLSSTFTGLIITHFEMALAACTALTAFIPMLMDTGGNSGSQSSVAVIRSLSLREIGFKDLPWIIWKEIRVAVICGIVLSGCNFIKMLLVDNWLMGNALVTPVIAMVVSLTLVFVVLIAKTIGCILPILADKIGLDPAVMASPFITTTVDALSLLTYFKVASIFLTI